PLEKVEPLVNLMAQKGNLEYNWENLDGTNPQHEKRFSLPVQIPGMGEFYAMNEAALEEHPEMSTYFERVAFLGPAAIADIVPPGGGGVGMHVVPVEKAIEQVETSADVEHLSHWLKKYDRFSSAVCSCRMSETVRGVNTGDDPDGWCIGVGDMADYEVQTGKGRYITYEEALEIIQKAEDLGFVHQITNIDGEEKIFAVCNCQKSVCYGLRTSQLFNTPNFSRSAYIAHVDPNECVACGQCVENCPAGAVKLGQRLCTLHGPVEYPRHELPDDNKWGPDKWDFDYRDHNRIETYDTGTAPCKVACPAHIGVEGYLRLAAQGRYTEALALIKKENPFPAVCGRVCNHRCEDACTRGLVDDAVAIEAVKKFIAERDLNAETRFIPPVLQPSLRGPYQEKIAIVGGGPAGLTCAYYLATLGYAPTVFERNPLPGGMMTYGIPSYKLEKDVVAAEIDVLRALGVEIRCGVDVGRDVMLDELREQGYKAFYLAIGAQGSRKAGVLGEDAEGVTSAVALLRTVLADESTQLPGRTVVVGGGNVAIDAARAAVRAGSSEVKMVCLEQLAEMPATPAERLEAEDDGVQVCCGWGPAEVVQENGRVSGVIFKRCTRVYDEAGRFAPMYDESDTQLVACDNVVMSIGQSIEWGTLLDGEAVQLGGGGRAQADAKTYQTAQPDVFVGGDAYTGPKFVIDAIAAGHEAAISIHRFVQPGNSLTLGRNQRRYIELDKEDVAINPLSYDHGPRQAEGVDEAIDRHRSYRDWHLTLTEEQVRAETARCLKCGASVVDPNQCIGCGICTTKCEFDAIHLSRELPECSTMWKNEDKLKAIIPYAAKRRMKIVKRKLARK
ncbi:MAG: FAD-dependent oxidoreductase, partial [Coriobacteriia bacterium]|nr:FAD-dependent oxidoreductase [Coriobacteriia bacterium]